jgi:hypothetical protein
MTVESLESQIRSLEAEIAVLKAQVQRLRGSSPPRTFADLQGILSGQVSSSEEEIDAVRFRFKEDDELWGSPR